MLGTGLNLSAEMEDQRVVISGDGDNAARRPHPLCHLKHFFGEEVREAIITRCQCRNCLSLKAHRQVLHERRMEAEARLLNRIRERNAWLPTCSNCGATNPVHPPCPTPPAAHAPPSRDPFASGPNVRPRDSDDGEDQEPALKKMKF